MHESSAQFTVCCNDTKTDQQTAPRNSYGIDNVLDERGALYGKFTSHAKATQTLKRIVMQHVCANPATFSDDQLEALEMICHKIGRIVNGSPNYADSWADIAGYALLVADRLNGIER